MQKLLAYKDTVSPFKRRYMFQYLGRIYIVWKYSAHIISSFEQVYVYLYHLYLYGGEKANLSWSDIQDKDAVLGK